MPEKRNTRSLIKPVMSLISFGYAGLMGFLAFASLYYDVQIVSKPAFAALEIILAVVFGGAMIYTRKQILTSIAGLFGLLFYLPIVVLYYSADNLILLVPLGILAVVLLYVIGILAYYLYVSIFAGNTIDVVTFHSTSPSQTYRCYVLDITDSSEGSTRVVIEPNTYDIDYGSIKFIEKGYKRTVYNVRKNKLNIIPEWSSDNTDRDVLTINGEVRFRGSDATNPDDAYRYFDVKKRKFRFLNS